MRICFDAHLGDFYRRPSWIIVCTKPTYTYIIVIPVEILSVSLKSYPLLYVFHKFIRVAYSGNHCGSYGSQSTYGFHRKLQANSPTGAIPEAGQTRWLGSGRFCHWLGVRTTTTITVKRAIFAVRISKNELCSLLFAVPVPRRHI